MNAGSSAENSLEPAPITMSKSSSESASKNRQETISGLLLIWSIQILKILIKNYKSYAQFPMEYTIQHYYLYRHEHINASEPSTITVFFHTFYI